MEQELDLTLKLGLPNSTVDTHLSLNLSTTTTNQRTNVGADGRGDNNNDGGEVLNYRRALWGNDEVIHNEAARNNVEFNIRIYNYVFQQLAGAPNTLNFAPYPMPSPAPAPAPAPAPETPPASDEYVLIDVPARRVRRNNSQTMANTWNENATAKRLRGCGGSCGGRIEGMKKCTNMNCNALNTPMWRRGPLGPKSLCNACGIKFRKEEERKAKRNGVIELDN
ncbi:unnamed protein product [Arabidopsis lyrata]|uniref:GATA transcription factor 29 n=1 Tax=Arabidopsis lyrata subsp. lyrata TaxID=81972 RepID=UPI000A29AE22|nr:GATA transcription factor 29 [Arabidopsis lyrata subsp. lyrata]CAH8261230.1 unnamed protein product [Arabidopsis lyrata]|eukprot:XP_020886305.1 GATA transcription factor 29 [Arabidopsis lyrata subsp. lyrata]